MQTWGQFTFECKFGYIYIWYIYIDKKGTVCNFRIWVRMSRSLSTRRRTLISSGVLLHTCWWVLVLTCPWIPPFITSPDSTLNERMAQVIWNFDVLKCHTHWTQLFRWCYWLTLQNKPALVSVKIPNSNTSDGSIFYKSSHPFTRLKCLLFAF